MASARETMDIVQSRSDEIAARVVPDLLRWIAGLLWLSNASWKVPPDFGRSGDSCGSLCRYMEEGITHPVLPGSGWLFEHILTPNLFLFGWATVLTEVILAAMFISGRFLRIAALLGIAQSIGIGLSVANADGEWYWSYGLMIGLHLAILFTAASTVRPSLRSIGIVLSVYGVLVALAHRSAGLTGDENSVWSLFDQSNDFPGDFGRNVFPGSILLGIVFIVLGATVAALAGRMDPNRFRVPGLVLGTVSMLVLVFAAAPRVEGWLGLRSTSTAMLLVLAFAMALPAAPAPNPEIQSTTTKENT
jgi:hypothetical protein